MRVGISSPWLPVVDCLLAATTAATTAPVAAASSAAAAPPAKKWCSWNTLNSISELKEGLFRSIGLCFVVGV